MTSTEISTADAQTAEAIPLPNPTGDGLELLRRQAQAMAAAHELATVFCNTSMVPAVFRGKPDDGAAAILFGAELGLQPQQALQQVFVVHGQPAVYARTMVALLKAKGYRFETIEDGPEAVHVRGTSPRGETEESRWTIERAQKAGYTSNKKYSTDPQAMLYAKAASEVCRRLAPDVLLGIRYTAEDLELEQPIQATAERVDSPRPSRGQARRALSKPRTAPAAEQPVDLDAVLAQVEQAPSRDELTRIYNAAAERLTPEDMDDLNQACADRARELAAIEGA